MRSGRLACLRIPTGCDPVRCSLALTRVAIPVSAVPCGTGSDCRQPILESAARPVALTACTVWNMSRVAIPAFRQCQPFRPVSRVPCLAPSRTVRPSYATLGVPRGLACDPSQSVRCAFRVSRSVPSVRLACSVVLLGRLAGPCLATRYPDNRCLAISCQPSVSKLCCILSKHSGHILACQPIPCQCIPCQCMRSRVSSAVRYPAMVWQHYGLLLVSTVYTGYAVQGTVYTAYTSNTGYRVQGTG